MAKYTFDELKSLKKAEIVDLLKKEGIEFDNTATLVVLRSLLLDETVGAAAGDEEPVEEAAAEVATEEEAAEETAKEEAAAEEVKEEEVKEETKDAKEAAADAVVRGRVFEAELAKRRGRFGRVQRTAFDAELARRRGKGTKATFDDVLRERRLRFNKK